MTSIRRTARITAVAAALGLALAACSSQGGAQEEQPAGGGGGGGSVDTERYTIAMVTHEQPGDTFWDKIRAGAEDAAQALNIELRYSNNNAAPEQATLVQNAIDSQVDGIAASLAYPEAVGPVMQAAGEAGIPTVGFNSGSDRYQQYGIRMFFGSDEQLAGRTLGQRIAAEGGGKAVCVVQEQGNVGLETRCAGVAEGLPSTENLNVDGSNLPAVQATIAAKLQQDPAVTHVIALGAPFAVAAVQAKTDAGSQATIATFDLNAEVAQLINDGQIAYSVDQQPYVQGFMAVQSLWMNLTNGNDIGGGGPVLTGPSFVDASNIGQILPYAQNNTR
jgi:simple sugar transport system substrate-binding protein